MYLGIAEDELGQAITSLEQLFVLSQEVSTHHPMTGDVCNRASIIFSDLESMEGVSAGTWFHSQDPPQLHLRHFTVGVLEKELGKCFIVNAAS